MYSAESGAWLFRCVFRISLDFFGIHAENDINGTIPSGLRRTLLKEEKTCSHHGPAPSG